MGGLHRFCCVEFRSLPEFFATFASLEQGGKARSSDNSRCCRCCCVVVTGKRVVQLYYVCRAGSWLSVPRCWIDVVRHEDEAWRWKYLCDAGGK